GCTWIDRAFRAESTLSRNGSLAPNESTNSWPSSPVGSSERYSIRLGPYTGAASIATTATAEDGPPRRSLRKRSPVGSRSKSCPEGLIGGAPSQSSAQGVPSGTVPRSAGIASVLPHSKFLTVLCRRCTALAPLDG